MLPVFLGEILLICDFWIWKFILGGSAAHFSGRNLFLCDFSIWGLKLGEMPPPFFLGEFVCDYSVHLSGQMFVPFRFLNLRTSQHVPLHIWPFCLAWFQMHHCFAWRCWRLRLVALILEPCLYSSEHINIQGRSTSKRQDTYRQTTYIHWQRRTKIKNVRKDHQGIAAPSDKH